MKSTILLTGATGTVGQAMIPLLLKEAINLKIGIRDPKRLHAEPWAQQVELVELDYEDPASINNALQNVDKLFLVTPPGTYQEQEIAKKFLTAGLENNLQHIVRISGMGAERHDLFAKHQQADDFLLASDIAYTALLPNMFMQNFYNYQPSVINEHKIIEPAGLGKISFIDVQDIAAVAVRVLIESDKHTDKCYELTGSESLDMQQVAEILTEQLGVNISYQPLSDAEFIAAKEQEGVPREFADKFLQFFTMVKDEALYARVSLDVETILGRAPISFNEFAKANKGKFIK